jgi:TRAP-type C4-dicarboxylate transport system substrate-binding protein
MTKGVKKMKLRASYKTFWLSATIMFIVALCSAPGLAWSQAKVLKLSHSWVKGDIRDTWANNFASLVEKRTNGAIKFELYPGAVLFKPKAQADAMRKGALDMCIWPLGWSAGKYPQLSLAELPGLIRNHKEGAKFARSAAGHRLAEIAEKGGIKILAWGWLPVSIGAKDKQILVPADVKGLKMRGAVKPVEMTLQAAGAAITKMASTEVYMALQTGTLDALVTTNASFFSFRLQDVVHYLTMGKENSLILGLFCLTISPEVFQKLTPEQKKIFTETAQETLKTFQAHVDGITAKCEKAFLDAGRKVVDMSDEQYKQWIAVSETSSWKWYRDKVPGGNELLDLALKNLKD